MREATSTIRWADGAAFALIPEWLLDAEVSDRAVRLYLMLGRYADKEGGSFPARATLAARLRCSKDTIDRAVKELRDADVLLVEPRFEGARQTSNLYTLTSAPMHREGRTHAQGEGRTHAQVPLGIHAQPGTTSHEEREPEGTTTLGDEVALLPTPQKVNGKPVTNSEARQAADILDRWNQATGQTLRAKEWLAKIIMRLREHPELTVGDHEGIIRASLREPWWKGPASPSVIYGNGAIFEKQLAVAEAPSDIEAFYKHAKQAVDNARRRHAG